MGFATLGVLTSDPNLLGCELARLEGAVGLGETLDGWQAGLGTFAQDAVLLRVYPAREGPRAARELAPEQESPALVFHTQPRDPEVIAAPEAAQPFRYRPWLFVAGGRLPSDRRWIAEWREELPEHLLNQVAMLGARETIFARFLKGLRETGQTEDPRLEARPAAAALLETARKLAGEAMVLVATNGRLLLAARAGGAPLFFRLLEGTGECARHGLIARGDRDDLRARQHRKCRSLAIASHPTPRAGWIEVEPGKVVAADESLALVEL